MLILTVKKYIYRSYLWKSANCSISLENTPPVSVPKNKALETKSCSLLFKGQRDDGVELDRELSAMSETGNSGTAMQNGARIE